MLIIFGLTPAFVLESTILSRYEERAVSNRIVNVRTQADILARGISNSDYLKNPEDNVVNAQLQQLATFYDGRILVVNRDYRVVYDTYDKSTGKYIVSSDVMQSFQGTEYSYHSRSDRYVEMTVPVIVSAGQGDGSGNIRIVGLLVISFSTQSVADSMESIQRSALVVKIILIFCVLGAAVLAGFMLLRPLRTLRRSMEAYNDGLEDVVAETGPREIRGIAEVFNRIAARMKTLDDSRQEFVSNVSHELKTPITSMKVLAESLLSQEDVPVELYKEFMQDIAAEVDRESTIIQDLLEMVRMDRTEVQMNIVPVNINELLEAILKRLAPIAEKSSIELVLYSRCQVVADADEVKLTLALSNFIENGIKYNKENGYVHVTLDADYKSFIVTVEDSGIGIPKEDLGQIFERFFRVDKSHSREIGGTGLGLAIARNAILLHRGSVQVDSEVGKGTTFTIQIPLTYVAPAPQK